MNKVCCGNSSFIIDKQRIRHLNDLVKYFLSILVTPNIDCEIKFWYDRNSLTTKWRFISFWQKIWFSIDVKIQENFLCPHSTKVLFARFCVKEHLFTQDLDFFHVTLLKTVVVITSFLFFVLVSYSWYHQLLLFIFIWWIESVDDFFLSWFSRHNVDDKFCRFLDAVCFT